MGFKKHLAGYPHAYYDGHGGVFPDPQRRMVITYEPPAADESGYWKSSLSVCEGRVALP